MSSLIRTPGAASVNVAVPTLCPEAFLISTTTGLGAAFAAQVTTTALAAVIAHARIVEIFMDYLPKLYAYAEFFPGSTFIVHAKFGSKPEGFCLNCVTCGD